MSILHKLRWAVLVQHYSAFKVVLLAFYLLLALPATILSMMILSKEEIPFWFILSLAVYIVLLAALTVVYALRDRFYLTCPICKARLSLKRTGVLPGYRGVFFETLTCENCGFTEENEYFQNF